MDCKEVRSKWKSYMDGQCSAADEQSIDKHIQNCPHCEQMLNEDIEKQESRHQQRKNKNHSEDLLNELPIKKQNQMLRKAKWKNRFMNALTVFALFIAISIVSGLLTGLYYGLGGDEGRGGKATQVVRTATQMTMPNVHIGGGGTNTNFFFTMDMNLNIQKQLGRDSKVIGQLNGKMLFNRLNVNRDWADGQYDVKLHFLHPEFVDIQPIREQSFYKNTLNEIWNTLDLLPEGTVSELAITFDQLYEIDDVYDILEGYDFDIVWYAIDTGAEKDGNRNQSPYFSANSNIWGLHEWAVFDFSRGDGTIKVRGDGDKRAEAFKEGLNFLAENEKLVRQYLWLDRETSIQERYDYIKENGVKTYGVVVTGPTKELLKLQDNDYIIYASLGEVDFWNWYRSPSRGTIYN